MNKSSLQSRLHAAFQKIAPAIPVLLICGISTIAPAHATQGTHFKALGPDKGQVNADALFYPNDFEAAAAAHPAADGTVFFSLCRRAPFDSTSLYGPLGATNTDAVVGDTKFTLADGSKCYNPQNEQNIVVNPVNDSNIVTSANDYRYGFRALVYVSNDAGASFTNVLLPGWDPATGGSGQFKHVQAGGDPVLAFSPDGKTLYYSALVYDFSVPNQTPSGVAVATSTDGGTSWTAPTMVYYEASNNFFNDKQWIAAGKDGAVYVTWTSFKSNRPNGYLSSNIVVSSSQDYGRSWSAPAAVSDAAHPYDQGSSTAVAPDGALYVAYEGNQAGDVYKDQIVLARSTDGGKTFTTKELGRVYDDVGCYPLNVSQGRARLSFEQFRVNSFPSLAIDPTTGQMVAVWADDQANAGCSSGASSFAGITSNQVKSVSSADGVQWTAPKVITSGADKVFPAAGMNAGKTVVSYYTRNFSPVPTATDHSCSQAKLDTTTGAVVYPSAAPVCLDYAVSISYDGGGKFSDEKRVSTQSSNPYIQFSGSFIGDYTGAAVDSKGNGYTVWTDFRGLPGKTTPNQDTLVGKGF